MPHRCNPGRRPRIETSPAHDCAYTTRLALFLNSFYEATAGKGQLCFLPPHCDEFKQIAHYFNATASTHQLLRIEKVQSCDLFEAYDTKRKILARANDGAANELLLFHGTKAEAVSAIIQQGGLTPQAARGVGGRSCLTYPVVLGPP